MRIGELAEATGASVRSLRYYEQQGLLRSERTAGGQRDYADAAVAYVELIRNCLRAGLPTKVIAEIMPCMRSGSTTVSQRTLLQAERTKLATQIADLTELQGRLDRFIGEAEVRAEPTGERRAAG